MIVSICFFVCCIFGFIVTLILQTLFDIVNVIPVLVGCETLVDQHTKLEIMSGIALLNFSNTINFNPFWDIKIKGKENLIKNKKVIFMANHLAPIDPLFVCNALESNNIIFKFVSDKSVFNTPLVSSVFSNTKDIGIEFEKVKNKWKAKNMNEVNKLSKYYLNNNTPILVFPEGSISKSTKLKKLKPGFFKLAIETNTPIIPILIQNTQDIIDIDTKDTTDVVKYSLIVNPGTVTITFGKPIFPCKATINKLINKVTTNLTKP